MPYPVKGLSDVKGDKNGGFAFVQLMGDKVGEVKELVINGIVRTKATLGVGNGEVVGKVLMDSLGKDGFKDFAENGRETDRAIRGSL